MTFISELKWKWIVFKAKIYLKIIDICNKMLYRKHCKQGYHKFEHQYKKVTQSRFDKKKKKWIKKTLINIEYFKCKVCGLHAFAYTKDKKKFAEFRKHKKETMEKFVEQILQLSKKRKKQRSGRKKK